MVYARDDCRVCSALGEVAKNEDATRPHVRCFEKHRRLMLDSRGVSVKCVVTYCFYRPSAKIATYVASLENPFSSQVLQFFPECVRPRNPPGAYHHIPVLSARVQCVVIVFCL